MNAKTPDKLSVVVLALLLASFGVVCSGERGQDEHNELAKYKGEILEEREKARGQVNKFYSASTLPPKSTAMQ